MRRGCRLVSWLVAVVSSMASLSAQPSSGPASDALTKAVTQLRDTRGHWDVTTEFLKSDGAVARVASGTYSFEWVVEDRVLRGESAIPALDQRSAILFYVDQAKNRIEMASVGRDGHLWVMTGPADSETRMTPDTVMPDGSTMRLRFTRFNITRDRFESRMEVSADHGTTWVPRQSPGVRAPRGIAHGVSHRSSTESHRHEGVGCRRRTRQAPL